MILQQKPESLNFAGNIKDIIVSNVGELIVDVKLWAVEGMNVIIYDTYKPDPDGCIRIRLKNILEQLVSTPDYEPGSKAIPEFRYKIGPLAEESFLCVRGGHASQDIAAQYIPYNFLTWQPQTRLTEYHTPHRLRYVATGEYYCKVKAYFSDNTNQTITLGSKLEKNTINTFDLTYGTIRGKFSQQPTYYDVWIETIAGVTATWIQRYVLIESHSGAADHFVFENSLGGFDTVTFTGDRKEINELESLNAVFEDETFEYDIDRKKSWQKYTGYIQNDLTRQWILDFFNSSNRFHLKDGTLTRAVVSKPKLESTSGELAGYEFTFAHSKQSKYLSLPRVAVPELLEFASINEELFFLEPRLNQYEWVTPSDGDFLVPVQKPNYKGWYAMPVAAFGGGSDSGSSATVIGKRPITSILKDGLRIISHDIPEEIIPENFNRYGNVDEWGHLTEDFHPHGGREDIDFNAQKVDAKALDVREGAKFEGIACHPEYNPGPMGNAWGVNPAGEMWVKTLGSRDGIITPELIYNRMSVEGNIKYFTDGIVTDLVYEIENGFYHIIPKALDDDGLTPFRKDDILTGYFRHDGLLPSITYLSVVEVYEGAGGFLARHVEGNPPKPDMVLARRGNASDTDRQNSIYIDGKTGKQVFLRGVNSTAILPGNIDTQIGYIGDIMDADFPRLHPGMTGLYARNFFGKGDFIMSNGKNIEDEFSRVDTSFQVTEGLISGKVGQSDFNNLGIRVTSAESSISQQANQIQLRATTEQFDSLGRRVATAESNITEQAGMIQQKVSQSDYTKDGQLIEQRFSLVEQTASSWGIKINEVIQATARNFALDSKSRQRNGAGYIVYYLSPDIIDKEVSLTVTYTATAGGWEGNGLSWGTDGVRDDYFAYHNIWGTNTYSATSVKPAGRNMLMIWFNNSSVTVTELSVQDGNITSWSPAQEDNDAKYLATGVDVNAKRITLTGATLIQDNLGQVAAFFDNGKINAKYINAENLIAKRLKTSEVAPYIEIDDTDQYIRALSAAGQEVFRLDGFKSGTAPNLRIGSKGFLSDYSTVYDSHGFGVYQYTYAGYNPIARLDYNVLQLNDAIGGETACMKGGESGELRLNTNTYNYQQKVRLSAAANTGILELTDARVKFTGLQSKSGVAGSWSQLYINTQTGEIRY